MSCKIVYVFNGYQWLWRQLMLSIETLRQFVKDNIVVFYGPPRYEEHIKWLESRCDLRLVETPLNEPGFVKTRKYAKDRFYGLPMKFHAYEVETPQMIHLDCDTTIHGNPLEVLRWKEFDIAVAKWQSRNTDQIMRSNLERLGLPHWPLMMDGFVVCRNNAHNKFLPIYRDYMIRVLNGEITPHDNMHMCVHSYNLALGQMRKNGYKIVQMPLGWHSYTYTKYVHHLENRHFAKALEPRIFTEEEQRLKMIGAKDLGRLDNGAVA